MKVAARQENLEVQPLNLSVKCSGTEVASGIVLIRTDQKVENVKGDNKNFGSFVLNLENGDDKLINHFMNFGLMPNKKAFDLDMRLVMDCDMAVADVGADITAKFSVTTKDSLNPAVSELSFTISKSKNQLTDIQKYFERAKDLCQSTHKWAEELKSKLITRLTQMISVFPNTKQASADEISDPGVKLALQTIASRVNELNNKTLILEDEKKSLNTEILRYQKEVDEKSRNVAILQKEAELNNQKMESAKKAIETAEGKIKDTQKEVDDETQKKNEFVNTTNAIKANINQTQTDVNHVKGEVNGITNQINDLNQAITGIESKIKSEQLNLVNLSNKKNQLIKDITQVQDLIAENEKMTDSLSADQKTLQNSYNGLNNQNKKSEASAEEFKEKVKLIIEEQNKIPSNRQSELERQNTQETKIKETIENNDKQLKPILTELSGVVGDNLSDFIKQAYQKAVDPNNFDFGAVKFLLGKIPDNVWKPTDKKRLRNMK